MKDKVIGILLLAFVVVGFMWAFDIGPFKKYYPPLTPYSGGYEPSFTGHNGPCNYSNHNCPYKCNDWREQYGGGSTCANCGHDLINHDTSNPRY